MGRAGLRRAMCLAALAFGAGLSPACSPGEGASPRLAEMPAGPDGVRERVEVHHLKNLDDPYADLFVAADRGVYLELGRLSQVVECEAQGYLCVAWPFVFSFPLEGPPSMAGWQAGGYAFSARHEVERDFCGRMRRVYLIEGADASGAATRTWYHPDFGVYAILVGQAEAGRMTKVERAYATCERGLFARG